MARQLASQRRYHPMRRRLPLLPGRPAATTPASRSFQRHDRLSTTAGPGSRPARRLPGATRTGGGTERVRRPSTPCGRQVKRGRSAWRRAVHRMPGDGRQVHGWLLAAYRSGRLKVFRAARSSAATPSTTPIQHEVLPVGGIPARTSLGSPGCSIITDRWPKVWPRVSTSSTSPAPVSGKLAGNGPTGRRRGAIGHGAPLR